MGFFHRGLVRYFSAALPLMLCLPGISQDRPGPQLTLNDRVYIASRVYASLANFAHSQDGKAATVDASYRVYLGKALAGDDRFAFSRATMEFLASLQNGHTMFLDMTLIQHGGSLPFAATYAGGKWVVTESQTEGLKPGDVIDAINDEPFEQFYARCRTMISASTEQWALHALFSRLPGFAPYAHLFPERFSLGLAGGGKVSVDRRTVTGARMERQKAAGWSRRRWPISAFRLSSSPSTRSAPSSWCMSSRAPPFWLRAAKWAAAPPSS